ncbi:methyltransferase [Mycobacterium sp. Dal123C01]|uniref:methyltransferase n=1 Tax=Mycobacterium sp. Dal123C01 TaxID=3457577 RepID=UPI00403E5193
MKSQTTELDHPAHRLLEVMSGAWATQAVAVASELRLADHIAQGVPTEELAERVGADHATLRRLMRYLASVGVLRTIGDRFELTEVGQWLRSDIPNSMRPLASLYGGTFYESFKHLGRAVRTGQDSFAYAFGQGHFDYFAQRPELEFNAAMAASAAALKGVAELVDLARARLVIDVGGGNGELLKQILHAAPHARGVLYERPNALAAAEVNLGEYVERCDLVAGDFTSSVPPGGDVYLLSRVLHDWDDQQCKAILRRCSDSMTLGAQLLVIERLLPEDDAPSLAAAWDIHMLCNVGGQERTVAHYQRLLNEAGFTLCDRHHLPLEFAVLCATKTA